jgi:hypothetical protein
MYKDEAIQILNNKALEDIKTTMKCATMSVLGKFCEVDNILKQLKKDIKKLNR